MHTGAIGDIDALTGLPGYDAFLADNSREIQRAEQESASVSLALFDLDFFTRVNREHGEAVGDAVLVALAKQLTAGAGERGRVYRFGGDAMMLLLPGVAKESAFLLAEEARKGFDRTHEFSTADRKELLSLTVSVGLAAYPDDGGKDIDVVRKANEAVYRAKVSGRNKVCLAREEKMVTKTSHYTQGQLEGLSRLAKREGLNESVLLREALDDLLRKYNR
ncbi:MAG: diguanylate cyclase [FCB group bacterium]|jgi:diguanylate cyclase (GGDEF)-like protein|nr:diguanylate cyclase [FCB group bacterium]